MEKITFELVHNPLVKLLKNGYNINDAVELVLGYVKVNQQIELNKISNALDDFLLNQLMECSFNGNKFGILTPITEEEKKEKRYDGVFYNYSTHIRDKISCMIRKDILRNIFNPGEYCIPKELEPYLQELFNPNNYETLCELHIQESDEIFYISLSAFQQLLESKGITDENYSIVFGNYGMGPDYPRVVPNEGVYINSYKPSTGEKGIV